MMPGRNDPCICGSGVKYKKCCHGKTGAATPGYPMKGATAPEEFNQLAALFNAGLYAGIEERARLLVERFPNFGFGWKILGVILKTLGKDSLPVMQKTVKLLPNDVEAHNNLGIALLESGRFDKAEASFRRAIQIRPDYADAHFNLGNTLISLGHPDGAEACFRCALKINPNAAEAHCNLGNLLLEKGSREEAEASYRRAIQIRQDYDSAYYNLGNLLQGMGHFDEAEANYRSALKANPNSAEAHSNLGSTLLDLGRLEEAEACCRRALQIKPDFAEAFGNLGNILQNAGRINEAETCFLKALQFRPDHIEARFSLASLNKVQAGNENFKALIKAERAIQNNSASFAVKEKIPLFFALGKCYDDIREPEQAFAYFLEGCRLKRATLDYDANQNTQLIKKVMRLMDMEIFGRLRGGGDPSELPIFILGMPRSGTTLVEQIIASHPEVHGGGELPDLASVLWGNDSGKAFLDNLHNLKQMELAALGAEYVARLRQHAPEARRITDKMPANFLVVGLIHLMLPNAKIIHVNRNPIDTCLSCFTTLFRHNNEHTYDLAELGQYYASYTDLMDYWRKTLPIGAFLDVHYEEIVADQEAQSRRIIDYCGLGWNEACMDFHQNTRPISTASMAQVRKPIYRSSVERWKPYEKFIGPLLDALGKLAENHRS